MPFDLYPTLAVCLPSGRFCASTLPSLLLLTCARTTFRSVWSCRMGSGIIRIALVVHVAQGMRPSPRRSSRGRLMICSEFKDRASRVC